MAANFTVTARAALRVLDAQRYYEQLRAGLGAAFIDRFEQCVQIICNTPRLRRLRFRSYSLRVMDQFPYAVFYEYDGTEVTIYGVIHTSRSRSTWRRLLP